VVRNTNSLIAQARAALGKQQQLVDNLLADKGDSVQEKGVLSTLRSRGFVLQHELACLSGGAWRILLATT